LYRLQKLVRRNRLVFLFGMTAALALIAGIVLTGRDAALTRRGAQVERALRERAELAKADAEAANQRLTRSLFIREWDDAERLLQQGKVGSALTWFARVVRTHPDDVAARTRLLSILTERSFALPVGPPFLHGASVNSALLTGDGSHLVTACGDRRVRIWSLGSENAPRILAENFSDPAITVVSPGDRVLVEDSASLSLWDLNGTRLTGITIPAHTHARGLVSTTPDGRFVMLNAKEAWQVWDATELKPVGLPLALRDRHPAAGNGRFFFGIEGLVIAGWEVFSGKKVWDAKFTDPAGVSELMGAALDQRNKRLLVNRWTPSGGASELSIWKLDPQGLPSGSTPSQVITARSRISAQTFSDDRLYVGDTEGSVGWVNPEAPKGPVERLNCEHEGSINSIDCGRNGRTLATASADGTAKLWDVRMRSPEPRIYTNAVACWDAKFSPDSSWFVTGGVGAAEIRETATGSLRHRLPFDGLIVHLDVSRDGRRIVACGEFGEACVWDAQSGLPVIQPIHTAPGDYGVFSPDGRWFCLLISDSTARVYETETGRPVGPVMTNYSRTVSALFTRDGRRLITATVSGRLEFWSLPEGIRMDPEFRHKDVIWTTVFSPDERLLLTASSDRTAALWETETGRFLREFRHDQQVLTAAFSPDARRILTGDGSRRARIWDAATGQPLFELMTHPGSVWHGEFSADGRLILTGDDEGTARLWDGTTGLPLSGWVKNGVSLKRTHLSPDGKWAFSAAQDGRVRVWPVLSSPPPAPGWLPELAEALAGRRLKDDGALEQVAPEHWFALNKWLGASTADDLYARWAKWFLVERMKDKPLLFVP
jgi:WD40 repeat protein